MTEKKVKLIIKKYCELAVSEVKKNGTFKLGGVINIMKLKEMPATPAAMKAMKAAKAGLTATGAFAAVAETTELKPKQVKTVITSYVELAASELKKNGAFKFGRVPNMKLTKTKTAKKLTREKFVVMTVTEKFVAMIGKKCDDVDCIECIPFKAMKDALGWQHF